MTSARMLYLCGCCPLLSPLVVFVCVHYTWYFYTFFYFKQRPSFCVQRGSGNTLKGTVVDVSRGLLPALFTLFI